MLRDVIHHMDVALFMKLGLVIFFACFIAITIRALLHPRHEVDRWSKLPLDGEDRRSPACTCGAQTETQP